MTEISKSTKHIGAKITTALISPGQGATEKKTIPDLLNIQFMFHSIFTSRII